MTGRKRWFPAAREARHTMIAMTVAFMDVDANRIRIGFGKDTPLGVWYDTVFMHELTAYEAAYRTWDTPSTSTLLSFCNLKDAEKMFFPYYRRFYAMSKNSPCVASSDMEAMGFPPRRTGGYSHHSVDAMFVHISVRPVSNAGISVRFSNRDTGSSVIPYYLLGAVVYSAVDKAPVTDPNRLTQSKLATRSPFSMFFDPALRGSTVSLAARWQNRRGELGPWSAIVSITIP